MELLLLDWQNLRMGRELSKLVEPLAGFFSDFKAGEWNLLDLEKSLSSLNAEEEMSIKFPVERAGRSIQ